MIRLVLGALALLFAPDCVRGPADATESEATGTSAFDEDRGVVLTAAVWTLSWDREGAALSPGGGLDIETDLGYHVHVAQARVLSHSVSFGLCDTATARAPRLLGLPIREAHAHAEGADLSQVEMSRIEDPSASGDSSVETSFPAGRYCVSHWLLARPMSPTTGPDDIPMNNRSLFVKGTFSRGAATGEIAIDTWWPEGRLATLWSAANDSAHEAARVDGRPRHAFVTVTRHLRGLFDGVDFEEDGQDEITGRVIDNLVRGTDMSVTLWAPGEAP